MFAITVAEKGGDQRRLDFDKGEVTIGRVQGNDVILPKGNVSKRHARIVLKDGKFIIVDLKSTNGTYVNGRKITSPLVVKESDKIYIGDFILGVDENAAPAEEATPAPLVAPPEAPRARAQPSIPPPAGSRGGRSAETSGNPILGGEAPVVTEVPPVQNAASSPASTSSPASAGASAGMGMSAAAVEPGPSLPPVQPPPMHSGLDPSPSGIESASSRMRRGTSQAQPQLPQATPPALEADAEANAVGSEPSSPAPVVEVKPQTAPPRPAPLVVPVAKAAVGGVPPAQLQAQSAVLEAVWPKLELGKIPLNQLGDEAVWQKTENAIRETVQSMASQGQVEAGVDQNRLVRDALNEALGFGPLEDLLADISVREIVADSSSRILASRGGGLEETGLSFSSDASFGRTVGRLVAYSGQRIDPNSPFVESQLKDGSRVQVALPPAATRGACLTIHRPLQADLSLDDLKNAGKLSASMMSFLALCIQSRQNILISGIAGTSQVELLSALANEIDAGERLVSVEDVAELALERQGWVAFERRSVSGGAQALVRGAVRMRPDRLFVSDVRGDEAVELVMAMGSIDGVVATIGGVSCIAGLGHLTNLLKLGHPGSSVSSLRGIVSGAVQVVVQLATFADGQTRIATIDEVLDSSKEGFETQTLFSYKKDKFAAHGVIPEFCEDLEHRGIEVDPSLFKK